MAPRPAERDLFDDPPPEASAGEGGPTVDLADPIRVGTASWTDKTLIDCGRFYPPGVTSAEARLRHYASLYSMVEVDSSYYAMPMPATTALWAQRTPEGFRMNVKAFRLFTDHPAAPKVLPPDVREALPRALAQAPRLSVPELPGELVELLWQRFREALLPLIDAGRLGLVHFQFAPWVRSGEAGRALAEEAAARLAPVPISVEFRHRSWFADAAATRSTLDLLRGLGAAHTVVDGPSGFSNSVPAVWEATTERFALVRLHGRNARTWNIRGAVSASDRFNYDYPEPELAALAPAIVTLADSALETHVVFNNNMEDQGQRNARTLTDLLRRLRA
jgi:uncharacterized protein YecE (DUF72 family)